MEPPADQVQPTPVRTSLKYRERPNRERLEHELFIYVLRDDTGEAARTFLAERGGLELELPAAQRLAGELAAWAADKVTGGQSPRVHVEQRWNQEGDAEYRGFVSGILNKEDFPEQTEFVKATTDILRRLRRAATARAD